MQFAADVKTSGNPAFGAVKQNSKSGKLRNTALYAERALFISGLKNVVKVAGNLAGMSIAKRCQAQTCQCARNAVARSKALVKCVVGIDCYRKHLAQNFARNVQNLV
jgi:hypothetical protein